MNAVVCQLLAELVVVVVVVVVVVLLLLLLQLQLQLLLLLLLLLVLVIVSVLVLVLRSPQDPLSFPSRYRDQHGRTIMQGLLCRQPKKRLGSGIQGYEDVKNAEYFKAPAHKEVHHCEPFRFPLLLPLLPTFYCPVEVQTTKRPTLRH